MTQERGPKELVGKPEWAVFPFNEAQEVVRVFEYGAKKYGKPFTYRAGIPISELLSALIRHVVHIQNGAAIDVESGCHHAAHVAANALMMLSQNCEPSTLTPIEMDVFCRIKEKVEAGVDLGRCLV